VIRTYIIVITLAASLFCSASAQEKQPGPTISPPLSVADIEHGLKAGVTNTRMAVLVKQYGVDFELTDAVEKQLRAASANGDLLLAISRSRRMGEKSAVGADKQRSQPQPRQDSEAEKEAEAEVAATKASALIEKKQYSEALPFANRACDNGNADGCEMAAEMYSFWWASPIPNDLLLAASLFRKACDGGNMGGCARLGDMYASGKGISKDDGQAVSFRRKACDGGKTSSCMNLGLSYEFGSGASKNQALAVSFYRKACDGGNDLACQSFRRLSGSTASSAAANEQH
jgi:TPR repeat protein